MLLRRLSCPICDTLVSVPAATVAGTRASCGACDGVFRVPAEGRDVTAVRQDATLSDDEGAAVGAAISERVRAPDAARQTVAYEAGDLRSRQTTKKGGWVRDEV